MQDAPPLLSATGNVGGPGVGGAMSADYYAGVPAAGGAFPANSGAGGGGGGGMYAADATGQERQKLFAFLKTKQHDGGVSTPADFKSFYPGQAHAQEAAYAAMQNSGGGGQDQSNVYGQHQLLPLNPYRPHQTPPPKQNLYGQQQFLYEMQQQQPPPPPNPYGGHQPPCDPHQPPNPYGQQQQTPNPYAQHQQTPNPYVQQQQTPNPHAHPPQPSKPLPNFQQSQPPLPKQHHVHFVRPEPSSDGYTHSPAPLQQVIPANMLPQYHHQPQQIQQKPLHLPGNEQPNQVQAKQAAPVLAGHEQPQRPLQPVQVQVNQAAPVHPGAGEKSWKVDASKFQLKQVQVQAPPPASPMAGSKHPGLLPEKLPEKPKPQQVLEDKSKDFKGTCVVCKQGVFGSQTRTKNAQGQYVHGTCAVSAGMAPPPPTPNKVPANTEGTSKYEREETL